MPINVKVFAELVSNYPVRADTKILLQGFTMGFVLHYGGPPGLHDCSNLNLVRDKMDIFREKVCKEVVKGRMLGPFKLRPIPDLICSTMGLVPKKGTKNTWQLITDLSHPQGDSINAHIPREFASVTYQNFDRAVELCMKQGVRCSIVKADVDSAFRVLPLSWDSVKLLGMTLDGEYYVDICLPFGASKSCAIFEKLARFL